MVDLLVIHPGAAHGIYGSDLANSLIAVEPPLWARLIAGYVRDKGYSVKIIDAEAEDLSPGATASLARDVYNPKLVCIAVYGHQPSASTQQMDGAIKTVKAFHDRGFPSSRMIAVGGHISALPEQTLRETPELGFACKGEGPITILDLLRGIEPGAIPGLVWRHGVGNEEYEIVVNPSAELIPLDKLHGNVWDLLPMRLYRAHNWQCFGNLGSRQPYASIYTSLGCPYKCSFCCINAPFETNRYRMRDPFEVVGEMERLRRDYGVKTFKIIDEMFILNENHYMQICELLAGNKNNADFNIWAYARVDTVRSHTLDMLRRAGFKWLALGIESGSKYVRDGAQKRLKNDDIEAVVREIQAHGINVIGNFIFGLPDDTMDSMRETLDLALALNCEFSNFYSAMAYPGSPLYAEAVKLGWNLPESWRGYSQHNYDCRPLDTRHVSAAHVLKFRDEAFNIYFRNPRYLDMIAKKFGDETARHVRDMTKFKLKRRLIEETFAPEHVCGAQ